MTMKKVSGDLAKNRDYLDRQLGVGESFDVLYRNVEIGKKNAALYMIDGFCKDEVMQKLLQHFIGITKEHHGLFNGRNVPKIPDFTQKTPTEQQKIKNYRC